MDQRIVDLFKRICQPDGVRASFSRVQRLRPQDQQHVSRADASERQRQLTSVRELLKMLF